MTRVSQKPLKEKVQRNIYRRLVKVVTSTSSGRGEMALSELLTPVEQIMLAKRLAAIAMLAQGLSSYRVQKILALSPATTARFKNEMENGKYPHIAATVGKKKSREQFWKDMEVLLRMGMPEMGKNRWKWLDEVL